MRRLAAVAVALLACLAASASGGAAAASSCPVGPAPVPLSRATIMGDKGVQAALAKIQAMLSNATMPRTPIPAVVASVVQGQNVLGSWGFGKQNYSLAGSPPPNGSSVVRIASITKVFTGLMMMQLRDAGAVSLDDPVTKHMPGFSVRRPYNTTRPLTLRQLASHTSGLARENPCFACNESDVLAAVRDLWLLFPQYYRPHYSNLGISLLGRTLAHAASAHHTHRVRTTAAGNAAGTGAPVSYEDYVAAHILRPLGMPQAGFQLTPYVRQHLVQGVTTDGTPVHVTGDGWDGWDAPCGGLLASADDMTGLMRLMFRNTNHPAAPGTDQVLDGMSLNEWLRPVIELRDGAAAFGTPWEFSYSQAAQAWAKSKAGELNGYRSQIALFPELQLGVFVSAMRSEVTPYDASDTVWTMPILEALAAPIARLLAAAAPSTAVEDYQRYEGSYGPADARVTVTATSAGQLTGNFTGQVLTLVPFTPDSHPAGGQVPGVLRAILSPSGVACRWLDDGPNHELAYFDVAAPGPARAVTFMGGTFNRVGARE